MNIGWDPIDELDDDRPMPVWAGVAFVILLAVCVIAMFI